MRGLDRLGWAAGLTLESYGARVGIRVNSPDALPYLTERFPPRWRHVEMEVVPALISVRLSLEPARGNLRQFHLVYEGSVRMVRTLDLADALEQFEGILQLLVAAESPDRIFVHAGVVAWRGQAILIPGKSHTGKSTLVRALLRAGATYYSDEYAVLDDAGHVHPYPRRLALREGEPTQTVRYAPERLGATVGQGPVPVGLILESSYRPGATWRPRLVSPGEGALSLLANTVPARTRPAASLGVISRAVHSATILRGVRGEAEAAATAILRRLERSLDQRRR